MSNVGRSGPRPVFGSLSLCIAQCGTPYMQGLKGGYYRVNEEVIEKALHCSEYSFECSSLAHYTKTILLYQTSNSLSHMARI